MDGSETASLSSRSWLGTPLEELYKGQGPWSFNITPIVPSKQHSVLFEFPATLKEPPVPHCNSHPKHWDDNYVRMPFSPLSQFLVKENGEEIIKSRWDVIKEALSKPIKSSEEFEKAVGCYNIKLMKFTALHRFFNEVLEEEEADLFFSQLLPKIIELALLLPDLIPGSLPLLKKSFSKSVSISQLQVASLLANAFLCTLIWRKEMAGSYPGTNFIRLFAADERVTRQNSVAEKLKCIIHYFRRVTTKKPIGVITFERKHISRNQMPRWDTLENNLGNTKIHITSSGTIEEGLGLLQVDFANKFVGGGVLGYGCVQEEIRFVICPELIVSRLFTEELGDGEALIITGAERYSNYTGYADSFKWDGNLTDETPFDSYGRKKTTVAVIDATRFNKIRDQFHCSTILRELNKAYVGFSSKEKNNLAPVATGNWGCGAFKGDPYLKTLIQLMACCAANRDMVYYSFGNTALRDEFYSVHLFLATNAVTIIQLWRYLCRFCAANLSHDKLYAFIQQCHFDMKAQPTLKQFLCFNTQKRKTEISVASTSNEEVVKSKKSIKSEVESKEKSPTTIYPALAVTVEKKSPKKSVNPDEIIQIMEMIDGTQPKVEEKEELENTLLEEIDKMKSVKSSEDKIIRKEDSTEIAMEVDDDDDDDEDDEAKEVRRPLSFIEDKKKKITDYFSKMTSHVNNYL